jgi:hypothetical protein
VTGCCQECQRGMEEDAFCSYFVQTQWGTWVHPPCDCQGGLSDPHALETAPVPPTPTLAPLLLISGVS